MKLFPTLILCEKEYVDVLQLYLENNLVQVTRNVQVCRVLLQCKDLYKLHTLNDHDKKIRRRQEGSVKPKICFVNHIMSSYLFL